MKQANEILAAINALEPSEQEELLYKLFSILNKDIPLDKMKFIQYVVCGYYGVKPEQIQIKTRRAEVVLARFVIMFFARKIKKSTTTSIGKFCGGRDHATVIHACNKIEKLQQENMKIKKDIEVIEKLLAKK